MLAAAAGRQAVQTVLSGLSGGIVAGRHFALAAGRRNAITLRHGRDERRRRPRPGRRDPVRARLRARVRAADRRTGDRPRHGRRRRRLDRLGRRRRPAARRPAERGRRPGPGLLRPRRRPSATVTDANLVLGRLDPGYVPRRACSARRRRGPARPSRRSAARIGLDAVAAAEAVIEISNEGMASTIRRVAVERGVDPRDFELVAFGGAGPLHAAEIAASLGMTGVIVPPHPGLASAFGTLLADRRVDRRWTHYSRSDAVDVARARRPARRDGARRARGARGRGLRRRADGRAVAEHALRRPELRARGAAAAPGPSTTPPRRRARRVPRRCTTTSTATASPARRSS